jgi:hypothetical protein
MHPGKNMIIQNPQIQQSVHILAKIEQHLLHYQYNGHIFALCPLYKLK